MRKPWGLLTRRRLAAAGIVSLTLVLSWLTVSFLVAYRLTRRANAPFPEPLPTKPWCKGESLRLMSMDGESLGGWFFPGPGQGASVLLLHGNGQSRKASLPLAKILAQEGHSSLAISLRAHGDSTGDRNDLGFSARYDVVAGVELLKRLRPGQPVIIQGTSLGAAAAIYAAADLGPQVNGYILESPYRDVRTAVRNRTARYLPAPLSRMASFGLELAGPLVLPELDRMSPASRIADIPSTIPVLLMAGGRDDRARPEEVMEIYQNAGQGARVVVFESAGHEVFAQFDPAAYRSHVIPFIREATSSR